MPGRHSAEKGCLSGKRKGERQIKNTKGVNYHVNNETQRAVPESVEELKLISRGAVLQAADTAEAAD